ncbi:MAG: polyhydroxyalkanoate synthesis repressor PhaR [Janthinobacterium lividum]
MADAPFAPSDATSSPAAPPSGTPPAPTPVVVKKYANRRLYNTETSSYITLDNLADMIRAGRDFVVYDAKSGEDITRGVLTQIIVEEESKGTSMLPTAFLRQLIGFYGDSLQGVVPRYLETAMSSFARQQQQLRQAVQQSISPFLPAGVEEMGRQNLAMIERAMSMFNPFHRGTEPLPPAPALAPEPGAAPEPSAPASAEAAELERLRIEIGELRTRLAAAQAVAFLDAGTAAPKAGPAAAAAASAPDEPPAAADAPSEVPLAGPIGAAAALAKDTMNGSSSAAEAAIQRAVDAVSGNAAQAASSLKTEFPASAPGNAKSATPLSPNRRAKAAGNKT